MDYIQEAERVFQKLNQKTNQAGRPIGFINSTQLRKFLSAANAIDNKILAHDARSEENLNSDILSDELINEVQYMKVRSVYAMAKDPQVKEFAVEANLLKRIDEIGSSKKKFKEYARLMEAMIAINRFIGRK